MMDESTNKPTDESTESELARLRKENEELKRSRYSAADLRLKVSTKGAVSLYGLGRFPVTLYLEQWQRLLGHVEEIKKFIADNRSELKTKDS